MTPKPEIEALLNAWLAIEALQPQTFPEQEKIISEENPKRGRGERKTEVPATLVMPFDLETGVMPWDTKAGDREHLNLKKEQSLRWYLPIAFVRMKPAIEMLIQDIETEGPEREPAEGVSILAMVPFDHKGFPVTSEILLSSFGWACGEVLKGRVQELHRYNELESELCRQIADTLIERDEDGIQIPTSKRSFTLSMTKVMHVLNLPKGILERPRVAIRKIGDSDKDPVDIINSFFLRDLDRVRTAAKDNRIGVSLNAYFGRPAGKERYDVLEDKVFLESLLAPEKMPLSRWPAPAPTKLVTLQQAAVNAAMTQDSNGLLAVNGPPGTGKTTLLRDIVAGIIEKRADLLLEFDDPQKAFIVKDTVAEGGYRQKVCALDKRLRGHGIVVASSNNAAVRNVSAEMPLAKELNPDLDVSYFPGTADLVHDSQGACWGLIAAVLGNKANRTNFVEKAWWDKDWGLEIYFRKLVGRLKISDEEEIPSIIKSENPPYSGFEALERWKRAKLDYQNKRTAVSLMQNLRESYRNALQSSAAAQKQAEVAQEAHRSATTHSKSAKETFEKAEQALRRADGFLDDARRMLDGHAALRPHFLLDLLGLGSKWRYMQDKLLTQLNNTITNRDKVIVERDTAEKHVKEALDKAQVALAERQEAEEQLGLLQRLEADAHEACEGHQLGPAFWQQDHETIHGASPWLDQQFAKERDDLFVEAIRLHRAFIEAAAIPLKSNLGLIMQHLKGKRIPSGADSYLGDLWDSLFLLVPLVSTTFASVDRLLVGLEEESIGWLIVDEAGQATPQQAVGAIWRARRAVIIGDPLQIPPVLTVPIGLIRSICSCYGAHPDIWSAPKASVQTLADSASPLMTLLKSGPDAREIGMPLLVHRRCQDPMFTISNEIAYGGLMVHAPGDKASEIQEALSPWVAESSWINVDSNSEKWSEREGQAVVDLLNKLADSGVRNPSLYIISPFRKVADQMRIYIKKDGVLSRFGIIGNDAQNKWGKANVGTVHTFQGKEAEAVFLVLGASAKNKGGSRNWAGEAPNILNVAATRAKKVLFVIGHFEHWSRAGVFATAARMLPVTDWPFEHGKQSSSIEQEKLAAIVSH